LIPPVINPYHDGNDSTFMPLGLLAIAANLKAHGFEPSVYIPKKRLIAKADYQWVAADILSENPLLAGFSTWCISYPSSLLVAEQLKLQSPATPVVFGGPQASLLPVETLHSFPFVDFVLAGESDVTFPALLKELAKDNPEWDQIPGLTYRSHSGTIATNPPGGIIHNLDELPVPAYELSGNKTSLKLDVGRGCPFKCTFCTTSGFFSKTYRIKTPDRILHEMNLAQASLKINKFSFAHDLFTLNKTLVKEVCSKLIRQKSEKGKDYTWTCSARIDCIDENLLQQMREAGCESVFFGIESGSEKIQKSIRKNLRIDKVYHVADICRQTGLNMHASFIAGFPDETKRDLEKTLRCAMKLALKGVMVQISELSLLPGTPIYLQNHKKLKIDGRFSNFSNTFCSKYELKLINKHPEIFSSFYYLPVKTLQHQEIHLLCRLINLLFHFRNTLYLLGRFIEEDTKNKKLLLLIKDDFASWVDKGKENKPIISHLIELIRNYLHHNKRRIASQEIDDVFAFEAFQALLTTQYGFWQFVREREVKPQPRDKIYIKSKTVWKVLNTKFNLSGILPAEHQWNGAGIKKVKGNFNYLLAAVSNMKCIRFRIYKNDHLLLNLPGEITLENFLKLAAEKVPEADALKWLKKMERRGLLEIIQPS
jgi:radical SAM superfamily enzyme YgiQ (UPF0313 family)